MTGICKIKTCETYGRITRGWCGKHYLRWLRHGDTAFRPRLPQSQEAQRKRSESLKKYYLEHPEYRKEVARKLTMVAVKFKTGCPPPHKGRVNMKMRGKNHPNWKGGVSKRGKIERILFKQTILESVLQRDNYTCQICEQYSGYLQVDHIKSWSKYPELRFDPDNCRTLCRACHYYITFKRKMPSNSKWGLTAFTRERG